MSDKEDKSHRLPSVDTTWPDDATPGDTTQVSGLFASNDQKRTFISGIQGGGRNFLPGDIIDGTYQLTKLLGRGGMGVVYSCRHLTLGSEYALKLLNGKELTDEHWKRFRSEGLALAKLNHPGIVAIYNMGVEQNQWPYYVMELLSGETLESLIHDSGFLPPDQCVGYFVRLAEALETAHNSGIVHRDIKPGNIMLLRDVAGKISGIKLVDFGIARLSKKNFAELAETATGLVFGTPYYMSPEQCQGKKVDERSDIYSLGCTLFEALTGTVPFQGRNTVETFMMHLSKKVPTLKGRSGREFSPSLEACLAKMLEKDPGERYQSMGQLIHDLKRLAQGKEILVDPAKKTLPPSRRDTVKLTSAESSLQGPKQSGKKSESRLIAAVVLAVFLSLIGLVLAFVLTPKHRAGSTVGLISKKAHFEGVRDRMNNEEAPSAGATQDFGEDFDFTELNVSQALSKWTKDEAEWRKRFSDFGQYPENLSHKFRSTDKRRYLFPINFSFGQIQINGSRPRAAMGTIFVPPRAKIYWSGDCLLKENPVVLSKFNDDELSGVELVFKRPHEALNYIRNWKQLEYLSFFNTITRAVTPEYDESMLAAEDLPLLENFPKLKGLGLAGTKLTGDTIVKMPLLHRINCLKIKRIENVQALIDYLPKLDNIHELWLVDVRTTDDQIGQLAAMKNLQVLRIRRGKLTPKSLSQFKKLKHLKHLYLDCTFSPDDKALFRAELPVCEFEPFFDTTYWQVLPQ